MKLIPEEKRYLRTLLEPKIESAINEFFDLAERHTLKQMKKRKAEFTILAKRIKFLKDLNRKLK